MLKTKCLLEWMQDNEPIEVGVKTIITDALMKNQSSVEALGRILGETLAKFIFREGFNVPPSAQVEIERDPLLRANEWYFTLPLTDPVRQYIDQYLEYSLNEWSKAVVEANKFDGWNEENYLRAALEHVTGEDEENSAKYKKLLRAFRRITK